jgi:hypothetical protein
MVALRMNDMAFHLRTLPSQILAAAMDPASLESQSVVAKFGRPNAKFGEDNVDFVALLYMNAAATAYWLPHYFRYLRLEARRDSFHFESILQKLADTRWAEHIRAELSAGEIAAVADFVRWLTTDYGAADTVRASEYAAAARLWNAVPTKIVDMLKPQDGATYVVYPFGTGELCRTLLDTARCIVLAVDDDLDKVRGAMSQCQEYANRLTVVAAPLSGLKDVVRVYLSSDAAPNCPSVFTPPDGIVLEPGAHDTQADLEQAQLSCAELLKPGAKVITMSGTTSNGATNR